MKKLLLALFLLSGAPLRAGDVSGALECLVLNSEIPLDVTGDTRVTIYFPTPIPSGCTLIAEGSGNGGASWRQVPVARLGTGEPPTEQTFTTALVALSDSWVFENHGFTDLRVRISASGIGGPVQIALFGQAVTSLPRQLPVLARHAGAFSCTMTSTATTLTEITGCGAPAAGTARFITGIQWYSSIISTTTNFMLFRSGTGANCGSGTTDVWRGFAAPAFGGGVIPITNAAPMRLLSGHALCFIHPGAGTRFVNVQGYVAP